MMYEPGNPLLIWRCSRPANNDGMLHPLPLHRDLFRWNRLGVVYVIGTKIDVMERKEGLARIGDASRSNIEIN